MCMRGKRECAHQKLKISSRRKWNFRQISLSFLFFFPGGRNQKRRGADIMSGSIHFIKYNFRYFNKNSDGNYIKINVLSDIIQAWSCLVNYVIWKFFSSLAAFFTFLETLFNLTVCEHNSKIFSCCGILK